MSSSIAILLGTALVALAIAVTFRVEIIRDGPERLSPTLIRHDRITGRMDICVIDPETVRAQDSLVGAVFTCQPK